MSTKPAAAAPEKDPAAARRAADAALDTALEQSFPASDPPSMVRDAPAEVPLTGAERAAACAHKAEQSRTLDEALAATFPASDPPAIVQPHRPDPDDGATDCPLP